MRRLLAVALLIGLPGVAGLSSRQDARPVAAADDAAVRTLVERFFATQAAEDAAGYFALWSRSARRPTADQLKFIFESGDDVFSDVVIARLTPVGERLSVRVGVTRDRTDTANRRPDGSPIQYHTRLTLALLLVREDGAWKIVSEGSPTDTFAGALIDTATVDGRAALMDAEPDLLGEMLLSSLSRRADPLAREAKFPEARDIYHRIIEVARRLGNRKAEGEALQNIANTYYFERKFDQAVEFYSRRVELERAAANEAGLADALSGIATAQYSRFEYGDALRAYREAGAIQERLGDENALGTTLVSTGNVQFLQGEYEGAIADYRRARELLHKRFNLTTEARALEGLGRTYMAQGDYAAALEAFAAVIAEGRARRNEPMLGNATLNVGDVHFRVGNLDVARSTFEESRGHFEAAKDLPSVGHVWQALALTDLVGLRFAAAEQDYAQSMAVCKQAEDPDCIARALVGLAFAQAAQEKYDQAIATYQNAIAAFTALKKTLDAARAETGLSQAYLGRKDYDLALAAATRAREAATKLENDDVLWRATAAQARAHRRLGAADQALATARDAVVLLQQRAQRGTENPYQRAPADGVSAFALLAVLQAEARDAMGALVTLESRRAYAQRAALAANEREIWRGMTAAERDEERTLSAAVVSLAVRIDQERQLPKPDAARLEGLNTRLAGAIAARVAQQQQLFSRLPALREWRGLAPPVAAPDLLAAAPAGATVVEFAIDEDDLIAVSIVPGPEAPVVYAELRAVRRQALADKIAAFTVDRLRDAAVWRTAAGEVAQLLPDGVLARVATAAEVIVVPDDVLWRVPFEALPIGDRWAGERTTLSYAPSVAALRSPSSGDTVTAALLAVAAPDLSADRVDRVRTTAPSWTPRAADAGEREARAVAGIFEGSVTMGAEATEATVRERVASAALLHVAAPIRISGASPLFSRVYLSGSPDEGRAGEAKASPYDNDGMLDVREIFNVESRARLVALTDGSAAAARDAAAAWPLVHTAWRAAGVPITLVARWPSDPAVSDTLLVEFYRALKAGQAPAGALRAAQAAIRAREGSRAPYFWAGWTVIGR